MRIRSLRNAFFAIDDWQLQPGQTWCLLGPNASGKSRLAEHIAQPGAAAVENRPARVALLSFESLQADYERELEEQDTDFLDRIDFGSSGRQILKASGCSESEAVSAARRHGVAHLLDRAYRQCSTGELRRLATLREALRRPDLLILDEPYEGLDPAGRAALDALAQSLLDRGHALLLLANRLQDIAPWTTHLAVLRRGALIAQGPKQSLAASPAVQQLFALEDRSAPALPAPPPDQARVASPLFSLRQATVSYDGRPLFVPLDWTVAPGQHTLVTGPNGCGKSTLLSLLAGDHPQCYANDIRIFGFQRGSGESIWDIKRHIGIVSPALHRDYRVSATCETVVLSGLFDSIGLYQPASPAQRALARAWLDVFELAPLASSPFGSLSYGQQRLVLVARAVIKQPPLLVLDEPTQGLDDLNRHLVLAALARLATLRRSTLLFVSHRSDESLPLFQHRLRFEPTPDRDAPYLIVKEP